MSCSSLANIASNSSNIRGHRQISTDENSIDHLINSQAPLQESAARINSFSQSQPTFSSTTDVKASPKPSEAEKNQQEKSEDTKKFQLR